MKSQPKFLDSVVSHLDCAAIPEFIMRLVNIDADYNMKGTLQWLADEGLPRLMISRYFAWQASLTVLRFAPEYERLQSDLARTLIEIIVTSNETSPILQKLYSEEILDLLLEQIMKENNTYGFRAGMAVLSQLMRVLGSQMHESDAHLTVGFRNMRLSTHILVGCTWRPFGGLASRCKEGRRAAAQTQGVTEDSTKEENPDKPIRYAFLFLRVTLYRTRDRGFRILQVGDSSELWVSPQFGIL